MIHLNPGERVLLVLHRHWIVLIGKILVILLLASAPFFLIPVLGGAGIAIAVHVNIILFAFTIYLMVLTLMMFLFWMDYYFDIWIITTDRIVDVEQRGLFNREVSEFMLVHVEDVTVEIPGMIATLMKFGNITIQTAGEKAFAIRQVPHIYEAKNLILQYSTAQHKNHGGT